MSGAYVWLDRDTLVQHGACPDGLAVFDALSALQARPGGRVLIRWDPLTEVWSRAVLRGHVGWLFERGLVPRMSLRGADLAYADLHRANLRGASLHRANLRGANYPTGDLPVGWTREASGYLARAS